MNKKRIWNYVLVFIVVIASFAACGRSSEDNSGSQLSSDNTSNGSNTSEIKDKDQQTNDNASNESGASDKDLKGTITMAGSTSMEKLARATVEVFMEKYPNITISPEFIGSSAGIEGVLNKTLDIGNASRALKDTESADGAVENIVAIDGIAVIVDKDNTATNLTKEQIADVFTGKVNNWSELGGVNQPIVVVGRESGSGTRGAFEELLKIEDVAVYANEINSTGGVVAKVTSTPGAIGYVSLDVVTEDVVVVKVNDVEATEENIKSGNYVLSRPFVMATFGEISEQNELVQTYFEFLQSEKGIEVIRSVGLITVE